MCVLLSVQVFAQPEGDGDPPSYDLEGTYEAFQGIHRIRVEFLFLHDAPPEDWTENQDLAALAQNGLNYLNNAFNPHNIFFYGTSGNSCMASYTKGLYEDEESLRKPNAFNISIRTNSGTPQGGNGTIPIDFTSVEGSDNGVLVTETPVMIHEVGHCLGLLHVFTDTGILCSESDPASACDKSTNVDICNCCGDSVCDTPPTDDSLFEVVSNCSSAVDDNGDPVPVELYRNYMAYVDNECRDRFTPEQGARMRGMLTEATILQDMQLSNTITPLSGILSSGGTFGNILVEKGTELEITAPIEMEPGAYILVEKGGQGDIGGLLRIRSTITGACGEMWQGVIVEGDAFSPQLIQHQGKVVVHSTGEIEHAMVGIDALALDSNGDPVFGSGGGIVEVFRGTLKNNTIGVRLGQYTDENSRSRFLLPDFYITDDYRGGTAQPKMVQTQALRGLLFLGGEFKDQRTDCDELRAIGLELFNTGASILSNTFENLSVGTWSDRASESNGSFNAHNNQYKNCYKGIETNSSGSFSIHQNSFTVERPSGCPTGETVIGVEMNAETTGFTFKDNSFQGGAGTATERAIGIAANGTEDGLGNTIEGNTFTSLVEGVQANLNNGGDIDGLLMLCNSFASANGLNGVEIPYDIHVTDGGSVRTVQGVEITATEFVPTGNVFSDLAYTFYNDPANAEVTYHFYDDGLPGTPPTNEDPLNTGDGAENIIAEPESAPGCDDNEGPCDNPPCDHGVVVGWTDGFNNNKTEWQNKKANLVNITDPQILEAEEDTIRHLRRKMNAFSSKLLRQYSLDTNQIEVDSLVVWLGRTETYATDMRLARHYFFSKEFTSFDALWPQIPSTYNLNTDQQSDHNELTLVYGLIRPHLSNGGTLFNIDESTLDSLAFWSDWCTDPGYLARSLLRRNGTVIELDCRVDGVSERPAGYQKNKSPEKMASFSLYPNPADQTLTLVLDKGLSGEGELTFFSLEGRPIFKSPVFYEENGTTIPIHSVPSGFYFVKTKLHSGESFTSKVIIQH